MDRAVAKKLDLFFSHGTLLSFRKGDFLLRATDSVSAIFFLKKGHVRLFIDTEDGQDLTLHLFKPGSYFPVMLLLSRVPNTYNLEAIESVDVWRVHSENVLDFLHENPDVLYDLTVRLAQGITGLLEKIEKATFSSAYEKIISILLYLVEKYGEKNEDKRLLTISLKLTHNDLASWTGMQRETVSRQLEKLMHKGIIYDHGNIISLDRTMLQEEYETVKIK
ncbi:MAG: Crp/Fnr family transcriptional regulator [Candidatus Levybacteria bacterium]|nr:Crp/Fnr family transcriptional regulator [Candidatus Levybacteria bacterium]